MKHYQRVSSARRGHSRRLRPRVAIEPIALVLDDAIALCDCFISLHGQLHALLSAYCLHIKDLCCYKSHRHAQLKAPAATSRYPTRYCLRYTHRRCSRSPLACRSSRPRSRSAVSISKLHDCRQLHSVIHDEHTASRNGGGQLTDIVPHTSRHLIHVKWQRLAAAEETSRCLTATHDKLIVKPYMHFSSQSQILLLCLKWINSGEDVHTISCKHHSGMAISALLKWWTHHIHIIPSANNSHVIHPVAVGVDTASEVDLLNGEMVRITEIYSCYSAIRFHQTSCQTVLSVEMAVCQVALDSPSDMSRAVFGGL